MPLYSADADFGRRTRQVAQGDPLRGLRFVTMDVHALVELARRIRVDAVRMTSSGNSSHVASVLSMADILGVLYGGALRVRPTQPDWPDRDRFILSKGHGGAGVYAALAEAGFFPTDR